MGRLQKINNTSYTAIITIYLLISLTASNIYAATGLDVITMSNGDIHNGTAAREQFNIQTGYGVVSVPYIHMQKLITGKGIYKDTIITRSGERFSGKIIDQEIIALRLQNPSLPLRLSDVAEIDFSPPRHNTIDVPPDAIETKAGEQFHGWIITREYLLQSDSGISILDRSMIKIMDLDYNQENSNVWTQITLTEGTHKLGRLVSSSIKVKTRYGQSLRIPASMLNTLAFNATKAPGGSEFQFLRNISDDKLLRDLMVDGTPAPLMVRLPGGEYQRGDIQGDGDTDEHPPIIMQIKPFAIGLYEVTFDEYALFCQDTGRELPDDEEWGRGKRPVINVSWEDAVAYTKWLSRKTGQKYRLPSDAEWEYAARAGTNTRYWWGQGLGEVRANCEGCGTIWDGEKSSLVGRFQGNGFGLHDTAGNVFEWVADCLHEDFSKDPTDGTPVDRPHCGKRIIRGGAWSFPAKEIRSANRWRDFPTRRSDDTGFRLARDLND